jgi:hypothetical protein
MIARVVPPARIAPDAHRAKMWGDVWTEKNMVDPQSGIPFE